MPSILATRLLEVPRDPGDVSDSLWRYADLTQIKSVTCQPTDQLVSDLCSLYSSGESAEAIGEHLPRRDAIDRALQSGSPALRKGLARNRLATRAQLAALVGHSDQEAESRLATLDERATRAANGEREAFAETFTSGDLTGIAELFAAHPDAFLEAFMGADRGSLMSALKAVDGSTHDAIALAWVAKPDVPIDTYLASWLAVSAFRAETLLASFTSQEVARRCTAAARRILGSIGVLPRKEEPQVGPPSVPLDQMAVIMQPAELAGSYVGSTAPVSEDLERRILAACPPSTLVNFLLGASLRKPTREQAIELILNADMSTREEWAAELTGREIDPELLASGPGAAAAALLSTGEALAKLPYEAVEALSDVITESLGDQAPAWDFLIVLSEEWEGTLAGLLDSAAAFEPAIS